IGRSIAWFLPSAGASMLARNSPAHHRTGDTAGPTRAPCGAAAGSHKRRIPAGKMVNGRSAAGRLPRGWARNPTVRTRLIGVRRGVAALVPRTRSSHDFAAGTVANFGFKSGTGMIKLLVFLLIPKFAQRTRRTRANFGIGTLACGIVGAVLG